MIKDLARKLSAFAEFKDFVIVEIIFRRGNFSSGAKVLKANASSAVLMASSDATQVAVKMIRPRREVKPCEVQAAEDFNLQFTAQEVLAFAESIGDKNPIHRLKPPIVPAFLILEKICAAVEGNFKLRFRNFITAGEPLTLTVADNGFEIICAGVKKVTGEFL